MQPDADAPPPESRQQLWSFRDDVAIEADRNGNLTILTRWGDVGVPSPPPGVEDFLRRMTYGPVALANAVDLVPKDLHDTLAKLPGSVVHSLALRGASSPLISVVPVSPRGLFELPAQTSVTESRPIRLSRFAFLREKGGELLVESPLAHHHVVLHRPLASWVVGSLGRPTNCVEVARGANLSRPLVVEIVAYLAGAGMVLLGDEDADTPTFAEDADPALLTWSPHDLLFHSRSRLGRHDNPAGAAFNHVTTMPPLPVVKPPPPGEHFPLWRPDPLGGDTHEMTLTDAVEHRRSVREFAERGPTAAQLGELLFRTARIRSQQEVSGAGDVRYTVSARPYPSAGSLYELDLYLTVDRCADLPRGIYHYDPEGHALTLINARESEVDELLAGATVLIGSTRPPVLITMTARIGRLSWVYDSIAYATTLKHVGVLQQTLYLVATMLGLAPCALAMGDSELATSAFGLDWPSEVSVGEFVIGVPGDSPETVVNARESA
ncbi:SagB/ThcOx family dehydrogenase [Actinophytocola oryzae]|uniref:SagB-type dehydrogenase family enzyme n=1 Tax=Actinophytocola oryzae TaxID=502181 RepID=A0A4R7VVG8_9PSEU|nr:SagB family peptide dehydrogenase [Actinophytocola oryzae]TDV53618.1 SagB-type dehydrogenase family enzyme [Actinophytocola oryzae]